MKILIAIACFMLSMPTLTTVSGQQHNPAACNSVPSIECGSRINNASNKFGSNLLDTYSCVGTSSRDGYNGNERVYELVVNVRRQYDIRLNDIKLNNVADPQLNFDLFLMRSDCKTGDCVLSSITRDNAPERISARLDPGTYYVIVDTWEGEIGTFDLSVDCDNLAAPASCENAEALWCDELVSGNTWGATSDFNSDFYNCYGGTGTYNGPDEIYSFTKAAANDNIQLHLFTESSNLNIFLVNSCDQSGFSCVAVGQDFDGGKFIDEAELGLPAGTYHVIVDGRNSGTDGSYSLLLTCDALDVSGADQLLCGRPLEQQNFTGGTKQKTLYTCEGINQTPYNGAERIYYFDLATVTDVQIDLDKTSTFGELGLFLFQVQGNRAICLESGTRQIGDLSISKSLAAGRYYVVVDSRKEAFFDLTLTGCACPIDGTLSCDTPIQGSNAGGGDDVIYSGGECHSSRLRLDAQDRVYQFTATETQLYEFRLSDLEKDLGLFIYADCNNSETCLAFSNKNGEDKASINLVKGQTVYVAVDGIARLVTSTFTLEAICNPFPDEDNDGVTDAEDNCPTTPNANQANNDNDSMGDACDNDDDNDGVADGVDCAPFNAAIAFSIGDACDDNNSATIADAINGDCECAGVPRTDTDGDGIFDDVDNCITISNADQANNDNDSDGDVCDNDDDNDGVVDALDCNPFDARLNFSIGDVCNDNDPNTFNDRINDDCICQGNDAVAPIQLVVGNASGAVGETVCVDITATEFNDIAAASFSVSLDNDLARVVSVSNLGFTGGAFTGSGCPIPTAMTGSTSGLGGFAVWSADNGASVTLGSVTPIVEVCVEILNDDFEKTTLTLSDECRDTEFFNSNATEIPFTVSTGMITRINNAVTAGMSIAGRVMNVIEVGLENVAMDLTGAAEVTVMSEEDGSYSLPAEAGESYVLTPRSTDERMQELTVMDVLIFRRHFIFQESFTSPYQFVAADIDGNGRLSIRDEQLLKLMILGIEHDRYPLWKFVKADHVFPEVTDFAIGGDVFDYPSSTSVTDMSADMTQDFTGIRTGDLQIASLVAQNRSVGSVSMVTKNQRFTTGEIVNVPMTINKDMLMAGLSIELDFDKAALAFAGMTSDLPGNTDEMVMTKYTKEGKLIIQWIGDESVDMESDVTFINLSFIANKTGELSKSLSLNQEVRPSELISDDLSTSDLELVFEKESTEGMTIYPNPVSDMTQVYYSNNSGAEMDGQINVFDISGRKIWNKRVVLQSGDNQIEVRKEEIGIAEGLVFFEMITPVSQEKSTIIFVK